MKNKLLFILLLVVIIVGGCSNPKVTKKTKDNKKIKVYNLNRIIEFAVNINDPLIAYDKSDTVAIVKINSIDKTERISVRGQISDGIYSEGKAKILKSFKGMEEGDFKYRINDGYLPFNEWVKCEKDPDEARSHYEQILVNPEEYYMRSVIDGFKTKMVEKNKIYLAFINYTNKSEFTINSAVLYEVKENNGSYLVLNEDINKYEDISKYLLEE